MALKRFNFEDRGIKSICIHKNKYLVVATFEKVQTVNAPMKSAIDQGFNPNLRNMAEDFRYAIEVY